MLQWKMECSVQKPGLVAHKQRQNHLEITCHHVTNIDKSNDHMMKSLHHSSIPHLISSRWDFNLIKVQTAQKQKINQITFAETQCFIFSDYNRRFNCS